MAFQKSWRAYQARLLDHLDSHLDDKRLHLVAAPGSGKTVLGLEVIRRVNQPTLVLAPTITIRDQWADRLASHFLPPRASRPAWLSTDIKAPALLTIATYQALHSLCSGSPDHEPEHHNEVHDHAALEHSPHKTDADELALEFPEVLAAAGFKTLVVDEAHHLRAEWWKTLTFVAGRLDDPTIIALTATPPYDVSTFEWQRYQELCGPVDAEVSVPELVLQGDLCPHQDYVYFSAPAGEEQQTLSEFHAAVNVFVQRLRSSEDFKNGLLIHPWMVFPDSHVEAMLDRPEYLSSMIVYLAASGVEISPAVLRILGLPAKKIPALNLEWLEILLSTCLYPDAGNFGGKEELFKSLRHELLKIGALEHKKVRLRNPPAHARLLTTSVTKLKSIEEIVRLESGAAGLDLRCVVLTDFIRQGEMPSQDGEACVFEDIGVVPIFDSLRRDRMSNVRLGVLSGSLVLVPAECEALLRSTAAAAGVRQEDLSLAPLPHDSGYLRVELHGEYYRGVVRLITSVFAQGGITVLVGTKSLLGEGWDAPCINTLILASFVGSYVLSNQMRGRSIRVDPAHPEKSANIWHLVCIEPGAGGPGEDHALLVRRCRAFVGVGATTPAIANGTERLGFKQAPSTSEEIAQINQETCKRALDRAGLRRRWQDALAAAGAKEMAHGLRAPSKNMARSFLLTSSVTSLLVQSGTVFLTIFLESMRNPSGLGSAEDFFAYAGAIAGVSAAVALPWTVRSLWRFARHRTPEKSLREIGRVVLDSLVYEGSIHRSPGSVGNPTVNTCKNDDGSVMCWIEGKGYEQSIFLRALEEVLGPIENARFLLGRRGAGWSASENYYAVPDVFARKREFAEFFANRWCRSVEPVDLIYTRAPEGRLLLLRARIHSLAGMNQSRAERLSCWK